MRTASFQFTALLAISLVLTVNSICQSRDINVPTPLRSDRIETTIAARPIGDPRVKTYYFTFDAQQGDIFVNAKAANFTGDIDVFIAGTLRPLAKMVFFADGTEIETGRVIYFRKSEKLILRIEGRTPNDDEAKISLRFAGSFVASVAPDAPDDVRLPEPVRPPNVAARIETNAKTGSSEAEIPESRPVVSEPATRPVETASPTRQNTPAAGRAPSTRSVSPPRVVVTDNTAATKDNDTRSPARSAPSASPAKKPTSAKEQKKPTEPATTVAEPLANVRLVVAFKDGTKIDRPLNEIIRFGVENGVLTIVAKNGSIGRYNMVTVASVSIQ